MQRILLLLAVLSCRTATAQDRPSSEPSPAEPDAADSVSVYRRTSPAVVGIFTVPNRTGITYFGTGVVVSSTGLVLTSTTAVPPDAVEIDVIFRNGSIRKAEIVDGNCDETTEGVLIRIKPDGAGRTPESFPLVALGDSTRLRIGEPAYTYGAPFDPMFRNRSYPFSAGVISGMYQVVSADRQSRYVGLAIETDAAINPGSDGGPLLDGSGHLIGIISLCYSEGRWLGTCVPLHLMRKSLPELQKLPVERRPAGRADDPPVPPSHAAPAFAVFPNAFRTAADKIAPAVVRLWVHRKGLKIGAAPERPPADFDGNRERAWINRKLSTRPPGAVTAFVIDPAGFILTAAYNVADDGNAAKPETHHPVEKVEAVLSDGRRFPARILGRDESLDVALLKVDAAGLPAAPLAASDTLRTGSFVAVLGRSEDERLLTLNTGILSAARRSALGCPHTYLQIDASLNWGNQGGPVIDLDGRVIGLANRILPGAPWQQNSGVGFAVRTEAINAVMERLRAGERIPRPDPPFLGFQHKASDDKDPMTGVEVDEVLPDTGAAAAGMKKGDVIVRFRDAPVHVYAELVEMIQMCRVGDTVAVVVRRDGKEETLTAKLGLNPRAAKKKPEGGAEPEKDKPEDDEPPSTP